MEALLGFLYSGRKSSPCLVHPAQGELKIATGATGTEVATEAAGWAGALSAAVIDSNGDVKTGAVEVTDTLRVVAEDGTVYTYVINEVDG